jgi:hypothetical protein
LLVYVDSIYGWEVTNLEELDEFLFVLMHEERNCLKLFLLMTDAGETYCLIDVTFGGTKYSKPFLLPNLHLSQFNYQRLTLKQEQLRLWSSEV